MFVAAYGVTHQGRRSTNEDAFLVDLPLGLFVVADGMGGHNAGEVASTLAISSIRHSIAESSAPPLERLGSSLQFANDELLAAAAVRPDYSGMGTTVSALLVNGAEVVFSSVGDSRIYLSRDGAMTQLTQDDSWVSQAVSSGMLQADEAADHPLRHVLTEVVGVRPGINPATGQIEVHPGDVLLLCSDGLHTTVAEDSMAAALATAAPVAAIADDLLQRALVQGASDNVTVLVVRRERQ